MPKTPKKSKSPSPEWARLVRELRQELGLNQAELGLRLHYSTMAISRWERGEQEPTDRAYIELGNLAGNPKCWYFWGRAGLHSENLLRAMPEMRMGQQGSRIANLEIVRAGSGAQKTHRQKQKLVAIPLLKVVAAAHGESGRPPIQSPVGACRKRDRRAKGLVPESGHNKLPAGSRQFDGSAHPGRVYPCCRLFAKRSNTTEWKNRYRLAQR